MGDGTEPMVLEGQQFEQTDPALDAEMDGRDAGQEAAYQQMMDEKEKIVRAAIMEAVVMGVSPDNIKVLVRETGVRWESGLDTEWRLWD